MSPLIPLARHFTNTHELCGKPDTTKAQMPVTVRLPWRSRQTESLVSHCGGFTSFRFEYVRSKSHHSHTSLAASPTHATLREMQKLFFFSVATHTAVTPKRPPHHEHSRTLRQARHNKTTRNAKNTFFLLVLVFPLIPLSPPNARLCTNIHASFGQLSAEAILVCKFSPLFCRGNSTYTHTDAG